MTVLDRQAKPAAETSHANGGQISVSHAVGKTNSNLAMWWLLLAAVLVGLVMPARAQAPPSGCNVSLDQVRLANPLPRFAHKLVSEEPITIVATGSSSTAGAGASSAAASYPNRLAVELKKHFPNHSIAALNGRFSLTGSSFGKRCSRMIFW